MKGPLRRVIARVDATTVVLDCGHQRADLSDLSPMVPVRTRCFACRLHADETLIRLNLERQPRPRIVGRAGRKVPRRPSLWEQARELLAICWWGLR